MGYSRLVATNARAGPGEVPRTNMTAIEKAAIELHTVLWETVGDTADWPIKIQYDDSASGNEAIDRLLAALNDLRDAIRLVDPNYAPPLEAN
jgi:hypothetical protein